MRSATRRRFIRLLTGISSVFCARVAVTGEHIGGGSVRAERPPDLSFGAVASHDRAAKALRTREKCAAQQARRPVPKHANNRDEASLSPRIGNFTKGLPHAQSGEVEGGCYEGLLEALAIGQPESFLKLARGSGMRLVCPEAAFSFHFEGADAETFFLAPPPSIRSAEAAAEMVELYWQALARDVPFAEYNESPLIKRAASDITGLGGFRGPTSGERLTPDAVFLGGDPSNMTGPYLSQFLWKPVPIGSSRQEQKYRCPVPGNDFLQSYPEWLQIQTGVPPWRETRWEPVSRYIITGRDLAEYIHYDFLYQAFLNAALILIDSGPHSIYNTTYYFAESNPYKHSKTEIGFVTFGFAQVVDWVGRVTMAALKAAWFQKWLVHRYLRPEEFGGLVHRTKTGAARYPLHSDVLESQAVAETYDRFGTYLLPQAYPEGCPLHPAYPSGHATVAGACATMLKALFDETMIVPDCVIPTQDGHSLVPYQGPALSVKGEIEKLAFNVAMGRNFAGIHWRCDAVGGIQLGEEVAISILEDLVNTFAEDFPGFCFTRFDGRAVRISKMV
jgi:hypothetical protein